MTAREDEIRRVVAELDVHIAEVEARIAVLKALLADEFGVSCERVRQIEARAFEKVQKIMNRVATIETPV